MSSFLDLHDRPGPAFRPLSMARSASTSSSESRWSRISDSVPDFFVNSTFRFSVLRATCVSALVSFLLVFMVDLGVWHGMDARYYVLVIAPGVVLFHHFARYVWSWSFWLTVGLNGIYSAFGPRASLPGVLDIILIFLEIGGGSSLLFVRMVSHRFLLAVSLAVVQQATLTLRNDTRISGMMKASISLLGLLCVLLLSLSLSAVVRIAETLKRKGRNLWARGDIFWNSVDVKHNAYKRSERPERPGVIKVLTGRSIWKVHFL